MEEPLASARLEEWRPSGGNDAIYMEEICCHCQHDAAYQAGIGDSCEIAAAMYRNMRDSNWLVGEAGPFCKRFKDVNEIAYRCGKTLDMFSNDAKRSGS